MCVADCLDAAIGAASGQIPRPFRTGYDLKFMEHDLSPSGCSSESQ